MGEFQRCLSAGNIVNKRRVPSPQPENPAAGRLQIARDSFKAPPKQQEKTLWVAVSTRIGREVNTSYAAAAAADGWAGGMAAYRRRVNCVTRKTPAAAFALAASQTGWLRRTRALPYRHDAVERENIHLQCINRMPTSKGAAARTLGAHFRLWSLRNVYDCYAVINTPPQVLLTVSKGGIWLPSHRAFLSFWR